MGRSKRQTPPLGQPLDSCRIIRMDVGQEQVVASHQQLWVEARSNGLLQPWLPCFLGLQVGASLKVPVTDKPWLPGRAGESTFID